MPFFRGIMKNRGEVKKDKIWEIVFLRSYLGGKIRVREMHTLCIDGIWFAPDPRFFVRHSESFPSSW